MTRPTVVSLRKLSRIAPELAEAVTVVHDSKVIGEFIPAPRPAQESTEIPAVAVQPARTRAPRTRAASEARSESAPGGAPTFRPAPKPGKKR
jgi:hypothetical protein